MSLLNKSLKISKLELSSRLVMPPMETGKANEDGSVSQDILDHYAEKSKGGYIGLIIIEHSYVRKDGKTKNNQLSIADNSVVPKLRELSDLLHRNGTKAVMQINHLGSAADKKITGIQPIGPSAVKNPRRGDSIPLELTREGISNIVSAFKDAAIRVKMAGFDGVEIHSAHGFLLNQFFSPLTNKRKDEYGKNIPGRIQLHKEIIEAIRKEVGVDFPILLRLGACDYIEGGITIEDSLIAAQELERSGIDILDISGGFCGAAIPGGINRQGYFSDLSAAIKSKVKIPVILTGGITEPHIAEELLKENKADMIGVGRAILTDPDWAKRAIESLDYK